MFESELFHKRLTRRELTKLALVAGFTGKTLISSGCSTPQNLDTAEPTSTTPLDVEGPIVPTFLDEYQIFPEGVFLNKRFFTENNFQKIFEASKDFPEIPLRLGDQREDQVNLAQALPTPTDLVNKLMVETISFKKNPQLHLNIWLNLSHNVYLGQDFSSGSPSAPAILISSQEDRVYTIGSEDLTAFSTSFPKPEAPIAHLFLPFNIPITWLLGTDLLLIINKGVLAHQANSAALIPIKFKVTEESPQI